MTNHPTQKQFLDWLKKQPAERKFDYVDIRNCVIASFLKEECNLTYVRVNPFSFICSNERIKFKPWLLDINEISANFYHYDSNLNRLSIANIRKELCIP